MFDEGGGGEGGNTRGRMAVAVWSFVAAAAGR